MENIKENESHYTDNKEMMMAWRLITETDMSVFLTGKAGTGKTTFLRHLRERTPKRMVVLAPTGVAAINAKGQTIHSFFQLPIGINIPGKEISRKTYYSINKEKKNIIKTLDLLIIDEVSMVRCDLLDAIDEELRKYRASDKPFGGVQLLMIGDLHQLSPVTRDSEWKLLSEYYDSPYFFSSHAIKNLRYVTLELTHIYRQKDQVFIDLLAKVRENTADDETLRLLNTRYIPDFVPSDKEDWIRLTTHNNMADSYNEARLKSLKTPSKIFNAQVEGNFPESSYPAEVALELKDGAQVMFIKNAPGGSNEYYNGKLGIVKHVDENKIMVWCKEDGTTVNVERGIWENTKYVIDNETNEIKEETEGKFSQYPLRLAWAITVHKSQGLTFDHAVLDINSSFAHGQTYVALSRCRTLDGLILAKPLSRQAIVTDTTINRYVNGRKEDIGYAENNIDNLRTQYHLTLMNEMFSFETLYRDLKYLTRVVDEHLYRQYPHYLGSLKNSVEMLREKIYDVAEKFRIQYVNISAKDGVYSNLMNERVKAATDYFHKTMREILSPVLSDSAIRIDNKTVSKQYNNALSTFKNSFFIKNSVLDKVRKEGFSIKNYLNAKANATLNAGKDNGVDEKKNKKTKSTTKEKKEKRVKGESQATTLEMFKNGMTIAEIAKTRGLTTGTIDSHLAKFVESGDLDIDTLVSKEHQALIRSKAAQFRQTYSLTDLKDLLPEDYTYGEIRLVLADIERQ